MSDEMGEPRKLVFKAPGRQDRGFLRRNLRAAELRERLKSGPDSIETIWEVVRFLAEFVAEPPDHQGKLDALLDASQEEFEVMLIAAQGGFAGESPLSPVASETT